MRRENSRASFLKTVVGIMPLPVPITQRIFKHLEKSRLEISFQLESDRMRNLTLPEEEFLKEIEVVKEERRWRTDDNPQSYLYEVANATAYQTSPYRFPVIGWMHDLDNMTIDDLKGWYEKYYAPNNSIVVVVGDVNPDDVYALAKNTLDLYPRASQLITHQKLK